MNKKIFLVLALSGLLWGCSQAPIAPDGSALADCRQPFPWFCRGNSGNPGVTLNTKNKKLKVSPYCVNLKEDSDIRFELKPPGNKPLNTVHIIAKDPANDSWLKGSNSVDQDLIIIKKADIPPDLDPDKKYYYGVRTDDACVDPRIRVDY